MGKRRRQPHQGKQKNREIDESPVADKALEDEEENMPEDGIEATPGEAEE